MACIADQERMRGGAVLGRVGLGICSQLQCEVRRVISFDNVECALKTLKIKCTLYGICGQAAFKIARTMFFTKSGGAGNIFQSVSENPECFLGGCPTLIRNISITYYNENNKSVCNW